MLLPEPDGQTAGLSDIFWDPRIPAIGSYSPAFAVSDAAADWQNAWRSTLLREIRSTHPSVTEFAPSNACKKTTLAVNTSIGFAAFDCTEPIKSSVTRSGHGSDDRARTPLRVGRIGPCMALSM